MQSRWAAEFMCTNVKNPRQKRCLSADMTISGTSEAKYAEKGQYLHVCLGLSACNKWLLNTKVKSVALVRERTIRTERPPLVSLVSANFFAATGCRVVSAMDLHCRILCFLDGSRYYFFLVASQLYSRGWVDSVPDPLLLRKSGNTGNRARDFWICSQELWPLDHSGAVWQRANWLTIFHVIQSWGLH
jgi:hypothetical protein